MPRRKSDWLTTPEWRREMLETAAQEGVSLQVSTREVAPEKIESSEKIDPRVVARLVSSMRKHGWRGPCLLGSSGATFITDGYSLVNGSHRLRASLLAELLSVPIVLISSELDDFFTRYDIGRIEAEELLQAANPDISIRSAGTEKNRTSW